MEKSKLLQRLYAYQKNPDFIKPLENNELAELVLILLSHVQEVEKAVEQGMLKGEKGADGYTPVADKDYLTTKTALKRIDDLFAKAEQRIKNGADGKDGRDGKDAEITLDQLQDMAQMARQMIEMPDFDEMVGNLFETYSAYYEDSMKTLRDDVERLSKAKTGPIGATVARRLAMIGDVNLDSITRRQDELIQYDTNTKTWTNSIAITVGPDAPSNPRTFDLWIDTG